MNGPAWRPQLQKLQIYEGIFNLNRAFHATLLSLERLENLGFFRSEYLNACKIELEHTRANANDELIETLRDYEQEEGGRFYRMQKEWDDQLKDPDDVFFAAKQRKEEIKEQVKDLQHGLNRMKTNKKKARSPRKRKTSRR
jgi:molecular chaperone DnaK (HSP70)